MIQKKVFKNLALFVVFLLFISGLIYVWLVPKAIEVEISKAHLGTFQETVRADGIVRSQERRLITALSDGEIKQVQLRVGDLVEKGQAITELFWDFKFDPVRSPINGVVSKIFRESPGPIRRGDPIVEIVDPDKPEVVAELLTTDAVRVQVGAPVVVTGWGSDTPLQARVIRVSRAGFTKPSALGVEEERTEVVSKFIGVPENIQKQLGSYFHVDVEIQIGHHENALLIPTGSIFRDQDQWAVYKFENNRAQKTSIEIAGRGNENVMVSKGLQVGDPVIVYPGDLVKPGSKVKIRDSLQK